ncbi:sodium-dependent nutrient amino acid transporter 1-like isoform X2 [Rhodnius prolixus]|uniref:sodium-dependent nutrient amino acid transporter 1-like isoform X2 n=1 Tax=Rhodnius prolixus TaxID=13249 RepID=UPI003D1878AB
MNFDKENGYADHTVNVKKSGCWFFPSLSTVLVALSLTFSLGNIVRLPRVVYMHGDGTFLVIYAAITILFGIPLAFLEIVLGQFCQQGTTKLWRAVPLLRGVGFVKVLCSFFLAMYYPVVMAMSLFYGLWSSKGPLPFFECSTIIMPPTSDTQTELAVTKQESCLEKTFLKPPDKDPMWFGVNVTLLFLLWAFIMLSVSRGVKSYRISAFFLTLPLIGGIIALLSEQLRTDTKGIYNLFTFSVEPLLKFDTWYYAVVQFFFSTHIGFGNITTCSGNIYSKSNAFWTAFLYIICNVIVGTGMVILVYLWIGKLNIQNYWPDVSLLFVLNLVYDTASCCFGDNAQIWASVAFLVLLLSGFTSMVALVYTIAVSIVVETKNKWRSWLITTAVCAIGFISGIAIMLPEKLKFLHMLDHYVIGHMVAMSTALELVGFLWIYGINSLCNDFEFVLGYKLSRFWKVIWFITPIFLVGVEVTSLFLLPLNGENNNEDDKWVYMSGWILYSFLWVVIIFVALWQICSQVDYNIGQKLLSSLKPTRNWGPVDPIYRHGWVQWREHNSVTGERDFTLKRRGTRDYTHSIKSEARYNTMSLPRNGNPYVVQLPEGLDLSDNSYWPRRDAQVKSKT